jgi:hypothetical protein
VFVRTGYHTQIPEISCKLNGEISAFTWATSFLLRSLDVFLYYVQFAKGIGSNIQSRGDTERALCTSLL